MSRSLFQERDAPQEKAVGLAFQLLHSLQGMIGVVLVALGLGALERMGSNDPEEALSRAKALDVHLAVRAGRQIDQGVQGKVMMVPKAAILLASETFNACGLVASKKEAVPDPRYGGEVLVERI